MVCLKCGYRVNEIKVFERSPKTGKWWLITRCPKDGCGFNADIEAHPGGPPKPDDNGRYFWKDFGRWGAA